MLFNIEFIVLYFFSVGCMVCVQLPQALYEECEAVNYDKAEIIQNELFHRFSIEVSRVAITP